MTDPNSKSPITTKEALAAEAQALRPALHRYAARLVGSVIEGEDVVQDALERAFRSAAALPEPAKLKPWLLRVVHNRAVDLLRQDRSDHAEPIEAAETVIDPTDAPEDEILRKQWTEWTLSRFSELPVAQRSVVILKDVMGESLADIAALLGLSVDAVKALLARGRARLVASPPPDDPPLRELSSSTRQFAALFNERNWAALRALLSEEVALQQSSLPRRRGPDVGAFFSFYQGYPPVRLVPCWIDDREALAVHEPPESEAPAYFMWLEWKDGKIVFIRDYRYVRYVTANM